MITVVQKVHFARSRAGRKHLRDRPVSTDVVRQGRIPRISRLMALAIRFEGLLREGKVRDQSELARLARVTQPRMTQIMNLLNLAPDIQEELLFLPEATSRRDPVHERLLRKLCAEVDWLKQREKWAHLRQQAQR